MSFDEWNLVIGQVVAPFGIRGELKVRPETDDPHRFAEISQVCLRPPNGPQRLVKVLGYRQHQKMALVRLAGVETCNDAEDLRGSWLSIRRSDAPPLEEGTYFAQDLVGLNVVTKAGRELGPVTAVLPYPAQPILEVGKALIPLIKGFVVEIDMPSKRIVVDPPEGVLPDDDGTT
jgi:16S rRNA processing protein RimM